MVPVYLTSQPLSGVLRAKAIYRPVGTFIGGAAMVAIVPNLVDAPELTTLAIILWVAWATLASSAGIIVSVLRVTRSISASTIRSTTRGKFSSNHDFSMGRSASRTTSSSVG